MSKKAKIFLLLLAIISACLLSINFLNWSIVGGDVSFLKKDTSEFLFYWQKMGSQNFNYSNVAFFLPYGLIVNFLIYLGLSINLARNIFIILIFVTTIIGGFFLSKKIFNSKDKSFGIIASSIFIAFNAYSLFNWSAPDPIILLAYASFLWLFYFFIKGLKTNNILRSSLIFSLVALFFVAGYTNLPFLIILWFLIFLYLIWDLIFYRKKVLRKILYFFSCLFFFCVFNLWWLGIIPLLVGQGMEDLERIDSQKWIEARAESSSISNLLKLEGYYKWHRIEDGKYYLRFQETYAKYPILDYLKYIFALVIIPLLIINHKKKLIDRRKIYFFIFLFGVYLFLGKSVHPPLGCINQWMYDHIPLFIIFRSGVIKFGIIGALSLAVLWGMFIYVLSRSKLVNKYIKYSLIGTLICLPISVYFPFFTGNLISDGTGNQVLYKQEIPEYYFEFADWVNKNTPKESIFMLFPSHKSTWVKTSWGHYGVDFFITLLNREYINNHFVSKYHGLVYSNISQLVDFSNLKKYLKLERVDYLIFNDDYKSIKFTKEQTKDIEKYVATNLGQKVFEQGSIRLYKVNDFFKEKVSASSNLYLYKDGSTAIPDYVASKNIDNFILEDKNKEYPQIIKPVIIEASDEKNIIEENHWSLKREKAVASNPKDSKEIEVGNIKYLFEIKKSGRYEVLANLKYAENQGKLRFRLDEGPWSDYKEFTYQKKYEKQRDYVYLSTNLGDFELTAGKHTIELEDLLQADERIELKRISFIPLAGNGSYAPSTVKFKKINPTRHKVKIANATEPFFLNFLENYHRFWEVRINGEKVPDKYHYKFNGLYNTWYINKVGNLDILISFKIQRIFYFLSTLSVLAILGAIIYLIKYRH